MGDVLVLQARGSEFDSQNSHKCSKYCGTHLNPVLAKTRQADLWGHSSLIVEFRL